MTGRTNNRLPADASFSADAAVQAALPEALIRYLRALALHEDCRSCKTQLFTLEIEALAGQGILGITHLYDRPTSEKHKIYGVPPIRCDVRVANAAGSYRMQLCKDR